MDGSGSNLAIGLADFEYDMDWSASIRAKVGLAVGRALIYATGGVAFAEFDATLQVGANRPTDSETAVGGTVGGGVEFAITDMVSAFVEGRYTVMGSDSFTGGGVVMCCVVSAGRRKQRVAGL